MLRNLESICIFLVYILKQLFIIFYLRVVYSKKFSRGFDFRELTFVFRVPQQFIKNETLTVREKLSLQFGKNTDSYGFTFYSIRNPRCVNLTRIWPVFQDGLFDLLINV